MTSGGASLSSAARTICSRQVGYSTASRCVIGERAGSSATPYAMGPPLCVCVPGARAPGLLPSNLEQPPACFPRGPGPSLALAAPERPRVALVRARSRGDLGKVRQALLGGPEQVMLTRAAGAHEASPLARGSVMTEETGREMLALAGQLYE